MTTLPPDQDTAGLRTIEDTLTVYEVRDGEQLRLVVLPVRGAAQLCRFLDWFVIDTVAFGAVTRLPGPLAKAAEEAGQAPGSRRLAKARGFQVTGLVQRGDQRAFSRLRPILDAGRRAVVEGEAAHLTERHRQSSTDQQTYR